MATTIEVQVLGRIYWLLVTIVMTAAGSLLASYHSQWPVLILGLVPMLLLGWRYERIVFNGIRIERRGPIALLEGLVSGQRQILPLDAVEMVTTEAIRSRRGLRQIKYLYRITLAGANVQIGIMMAIRHHSSSAELVKQLFNVLAESKLDPRSFELKQHLNERHPKEALIGFARKIETSDLDGEVYHKLPTTLLRQLANSLKLEGYMQQALHCFSLAYERDPHNAHLLYEMARFLRSLAAINDPRLLNRSRACLRLAAFLGRNEPHLLERIGETYFERLEYKLAARCFLKALLIEPTLYRANVGLAEIALRDGKLAHVAHFYQSAATASEDRAQRDLATREAHYYSRLCNDEDYYEAEVNRITKLRSFQWARNLSGLLFLIFWILALLSGRFSNELGGFAWSAVLSTSLVWFASFLLSLHYSQRHQ
ncbi:MAG: hypothetical protein AB1489_21810 [Acidobacteriota bacterium]